MSMFKQSVSFGFDLDRFPLIAPLSTNEYGDHGAKKQNPKAGKTI
jgi:hypothetical protein